MMLETLWVIVQVVLGLGGLLAIPVAFGLILNEPLDRIVSDIADSQQNAKK
jgi:hypothetical protein